MRDVPDGGHRAGNSGYPDKQAKRQWIALQKLPRRSFAAMRELEEQVAQLKAAKSLNWPSPKAIRSSDDWDTATISPASALPVRFFDQHLREELSHCLPPVLQKLHHLSERKSEPCSAIPKNGGSPKPLAKIANRFVNP